MQTPMPFYREATTGVTAEWMAEHAETARATSKALERRIEAEQRMQETIDADRKTYRVPGGCRR